jgi:hypothetical protein
MSDSFTFSADQVASLEKSNVPQGARDRAVAAATAAKLPASSADGLAYALSRSGLRAAKTGKSL